MHPSSFVRHGCVVAATLTCLGLVGCARSHTASRLDASAADADLPDTDAAREDADGPDAREPDAARPRDAAANDGDSDVTSADADDAMASTPDVLDLPDIPPSPDAPPCMRERFGNCLHWERLPVQGFHVSLADLNSDGRQDLFTTTQRGEGEVFALEEGILDPSDTSRPPEPIARVQSPADGVELRVGLHFADVDSDGSADRISLELGAEDDSLLLRVMRGDGYGGFEPRAEREVCAGDRLLSPLDVNGDGDREVIVLEDCDDDGRSRLRVFDGLTLEPRWEVSAHVEQVGAGDLDGDGAVELWVVEQGDRDESALVAYAPDEDGGRLEPSARVPLPEGEVLGLFTGDFDGDGATDATVWLQSEEASRSVAVWVGTEAGEAKVIRTLPFQEKVFALAMSDVDGDCLDEVVAVTEDARGYRATALGHMLEGTLTLDVYYNDDPPPRGRLLSTVRPNADQMPRLLGVDRDGAVHYAIDGICDI